MNKDASNFKKILFATMLIFILCMVFVYFWGTILLRSVIAHSYVDKTTLIATSIGKVIDETIRDIRIYLSGMSSLDAVRISDSEDEEYKPIEPMEQGTDERINAELKKILEWDENIVEMLITDRVGGLMGSAKETDDYYRADEEWWQKTYDNKKGDICVGDISFFEPEGIWTMSFSVPIIGQYGHLVGLCRAKVDVKKILGHLQHFRVGTTGRAALIDDKGFFIYHSAINTMIAAIYSDAALKKLEEDESGFMILSDGYVHKRKTFLGFAKVMLPYLLKHNLSWIVILESDPAEVFEPVNSLIRQGVAITITLLIFLTISAVIALKRFKGPCVFQTLKKV